MNWLELKNSEIFFCDKDITRKRLLWVPLAILIAILAMLSFMVFVPIHCVLWLCGYHGLYYKSPETTYWGPNDMMMEKRPK